MKAQLSRSIAVNAAWFGGLALIIGTLVVVSVVRQEGRKNEVAALEREIDGKRRSLRNFPNVEEHDARLEAIEAELRDCRGMAASESLRMSALSDAARAAGVNLISLRGLGQKLSEDELVISRTCILSGVGGYREIAHFLDGIYATRGMVSIDEVDIERAEGELLQADLQVTWHAPNPDAPEEASE